jgi:hypothetical protein
LNLKLSWFENRALNEENTESSAALERHDSMKGARAHLKKESLMQSDLLELVEDADAGVRDAADEAGV